MNKEGRTRAAFSAQSSDSNQLIAGYNSPLSSSFLMWIRGCMIAVKCGNAASVDLIIKLHYGFTIVKSFLDIHTCTQQSM